MQKIWNPVEKINTISVIKHEDMNIKPPLYVLQECQQSENQVKKNLQWSVAMAH